MPRHAAALLDDERLPVALPRTPRIACWDIEASNLAANIGYAVCGCIRWVGDAPGKVQTVRIDRTPQFRRDPTDDRGVVEGLAEALNSADLWVTWYGGRFDLPFIQTRLLEYRLPPLAPIPHFDGWRVARFKLRFHSNRLVTVGEFLGSPPKTPIQWKCWRRAAAGHRQSIKTIADHCQADVLCLEDVYHKLKPFHGGLANASIMRLGNTSACPVCGSRRLVPAGTVVARVTESVKYQCRSCGAWSKGPPVRVDGERIR